MRKIKSVFVRLAGGSTDQQTRVEGAEGKPTPGPWHYERLTDCAKTGEEFGTIVSGNLMVAESVYKKDADLIVAAPELLTHLQAWVAGCGDEHFSTKEECRELLSRSGALIAKVLNAD